MGWRTITLKLHKPGKNKRELLDTAIANYNEAFRYLLRKAFSERDEILEKFSGNSRRYTARALSAWIDKETLSELNQFDVQPFKDSLKLDFGMLLAGYLRLREVEPGVGFPGIGGISRRNGNAEYAVDTDGAIRYDDMAETGGTGLRPLYFCRYDVKRSYCLLYDQEKDRYYAKLHLLNRRNVRTIPNGTKRNGNLVYIHKEGKALEMGKRKETFIIVPLSFGKWQEKTLRRALENPECLRTAKLYRKDREYYLTVSVETDEVEPVKTINFMGVSRGLKNPLNYTVVSQQGHVLSEGMIHAPDAQFRKTKREAGLARMTRVTGKPTEYVLEKNREISPGALHMAVNCISEIAAANNAQVIVQNLSEKGDGINRIMMDSNAVTPAGNGTGTHPGLVAKNIPAYGMRDYNRLLGLLEYKLPDRGLPPPVKVSSVDIFTACPCCRNNVRSNRNMKNLFICTACGETMDIEKLGSLNLARKLINYSLSKIKIRTARTKDGILFSNEILGLNCFCSHQADYRKLLRSELAQIIENVQNGNDAKALAGAEAAAVRTWNAKKSMVKKLTSTQDFMNMIEYV